MSRQQTVARRWTVTWRGTSRDALLCAVGHRPANYRLRLQQRRLAADNCDDDDVAQTDNDCRNDEDSH